MRITSIPKYNLNTQQERMSFKAKPPITKPVQNLAEKTAKPNFFSKLKNKVNDFLIYNEWLKVDNVIFLTDETIGEKFIKELGHRPDLMEKILTYEVTSTHIVMPIEDMAEENKAVIAEYYKERPEAYKSLLEARKKGDEKIAKRFIEYRDWSDSKNSDYGNSQLIPKLGHNPELLLNVLFKKPPIISSTFWDLIRRNGEDRQFLEYFNDKPEFFEAFLNKSELLKRGYENRQSLGKAIINSDSIDIKSYWYTSDEDDAFSTRSTIYAGLLLKNDENKAVIKKFYERYHQDTEFIKDILHFKPELGRELIREPQYLIPLIEIEKEQPPENRPISKYIATSYLLDIQKFKNIIGKADIENLKAINEILDNAGMTEKVYKSWIAQSPNLSDLGWNRKMGSAGPIIKEVNKALTNYPNLLADLYINGIFGLQFAGNFFGSDIQDYQELYEIIKDADNFNEFTKELKKAIKKDYSDNLKIFDIYITNRKYLEAETAKHNGFYSDAEFIDMLPLEIKHLNSIFTMPYNSRQDTVLMRFADILPSDLDEKHLDKYTKILHSMRYLMDLDARDKMNIPLIEKIIHAENDLFFMNIHHHIFKYEPTIEYEINNIKNPQFKELVNKHLKLSFTDIYDAINCESKQAFDKLIPSINSKLCPKTDVIKTIGELLNNTSVEFKKYVTDKMSEYI